MKYKIISKLIDNQPMAEIATELDVPYTKVLRINKEFKEAKEANTLSSLVDIDTEMLDILMAQYQDSTPEGLQSLVSTAVEDLREAKTIIDSLSDDMQLAASSITTQIKNKAAHTVHVEDLLVLANALCAIQNAFFNKNSTQVNVLNDYSGSKQYSEFLGD